MTHHKKFDNTNYKARVHCPALLDFPLYSDTIDLTQVEHS